MNEVMLLEDGLGGKKDYTILFKETLENKNYLVGYPVESPDGEVEIFVENENHEFVHVSTEQEIEQVYNDFQDNSQNITFIDDTKAIHKGEIIEVEGKNYVCFAVVEYESELFVYLITEDRPFEMKFAKEVFDDSDEIKLTIIGDFYEKEKALSLLQRNVLGNPIEEDE